MRLNGFSVLVVEDDPSLQSLAKIALQKFGCRVTGSSSGFEAIALCHDLDRHFDAILMDIKMPGMDGLEATRRLRANPKTRSTPIVIVSGLAMESDREEGMKAGADAYVTKPYGFQELLDVLCRYRNQAVAGPSR